MYDDCFLDGSLTGISGSERTGIAEATITGASMMLGGPDGRCEML